MEGGVMSCGVSTTHAVPSQRTVQQESPNQISFPSDLFSLLYSHVIQFWKSCKLGKIRVLVRIC
jgi:hypothetical protein